jgi:putative endonuclease
MAKHNILGEIGETVASEFLESKGHKIFDRNFRKPYGELDIVSEGKRGELHFVEVKSVSWETAYRPEENVHAKKIERLKKIIQTYLTHKGFKGDWQVDVVVVYLDQANKKAKVSYLENVIFES